jgi:phenylpropionate dioxygenase-like ring-hydroxylating dioxygenase large terminal subunit
MDNNIVEEWKIDPEAPEHSLEAKQPFIDNGSEQLDPSRYYDPEFMDQEWRRLWTRTWLIAGVETDIPESGDYTVFRVLTEEVLVVRQEDGGVRAFYNVCSHRGNRMVRNDRGSLNCFTCSFHSWCYNLDGSLRSMTDRQTFRDEVAAQARGLDEVRCETRAGIVFINLDQHAPPLNDRIGLPEGYLEAYRIDKMHVVRHVVSEWAANWKTGVDAFYETYHLHAVHPETQPVMDDLSVQVDLYPHGASRMIVPLASKSQRIEDQDSMNPGLEFMMHDAGMDPATYSGSARGVRRAIQQCKRQRSDRLGLGYERFTDCQLSDSWATGVFPNVQIGCHPEGVFLMRFLPHPTEPERFFYDTMTLFRPVDDPDYKVPGWMGLPEGTDTSGELRPDTEYVPLGEPPNLGQVLDQDSELLPELQKGIRSRGFKGAIWSEQEQRLRHFHREVDSYLNGSK